ncbi:Coiled-coil domain-containing protein 47 [Bienertia sinuspersici]
MAGEEAKDPLKDVDWKNMGGGVNTNDKAENGQPIVKKRLPKKIRQIPESYFLPRKSLPSAIAFYGSFIVAGVGAGMLLEVWINKKVREDGGVIWEFDK